MKSEKVKVKSDKRKKNYFLKNIDLKNSINKEVYNKIINLDSYHHLFYGTMRFGSCPTLPNKPIRLKKKLIVVLKYL